MNHSNLSRRNFLKASALAGVGVSVAGVSLGAEPVAPSSGNLSLGDISLTRPRPAGQKPVNNLTTKPLEKVRVAVIGSVTTGSSPMNIPDFTRGLWKTMPPLRIAETA